MDIRFLIQLADCCRGYFASPQRFRDILYTSYRYSCQVHLDERLFYIALPSAIPLDNGCFKGNALQARDMECDISRSASKVPIIVTTAVALTGFAALVPRRLSQFFRFFLQQLVERFLYTPSFSCTIFSDMVCSLLSEWCVAASFYQSSANLVSFLPIRFCAFYFTLSNPQAAYPVFFSRIRRFIVRGT